MPISSIVRRAFTLPTPGRASRTARTLVLPTVSSPSDMRSSSSRESEPILSRSLSSDRNLRAAAAFKFRSELKERLKMGSLSLDELLRMSDGDETVGKTKVLAVLEALPGVGKVKARRTMEEIGIAETRRLRGLGKEQRAKLLDAFA